MTAVKLKDSDSGAIVHQIDWSDWLGDGTITTSAWAVLPAGELVIGTTLIDSTQKFTSAKISDGVAGKVYRLTNSILTSTGESPERTITVRAGDR